MQKYKVAAFDLDGTLTQHRSRLEKQNTALLDELGKRYRLLIMGAGQCRRIYEQMNRYPIDIVGNYGMQYCVYDEAAGDLVTMRDEKAGCDRASVSSRITMLREKYGYENFAGDNVEFHDSGCVTFPLLGTKADIGDKLRFDPTREKRRAIYDEVCALFPEYMVFVGGSSSFDMAPKPYDKCYALDQYCRENGLGHGEVCYVGDDYGLGGNDEAVYKSDFRFFRVDDYRRLRQYLDELLKN